MYFSRRLGGSSPLSRSRARRFADSTSAFLPVVSMTLRSSSTPCSNGPGSASATGSASDYRERRSANRSTVDAIKRDMTESEQG